MDENLFLKVLNKIPLFEELNEGQHKELVKNITLEYFPAGKKLFAEGDAGDAMYIIKTGLVKISRKDDFGIEKEIATLSANDFFGEMALISDEPRNATAETISDCELFSIKRSDFLKLIEKTPGLANRISTEFIKRVKKNQKPTIHPE